MKSVLVWCFIVTAANAAATYHPYPNGYHIDVGIPLGKKIYEAESAIVRGSRIYGGRPSPLGAHPYLIGALTTVVNSASLSISTASMLTNTRALWAAHCWNNGETFGISTTLAFGSEFLFYGGTRITTSSVERHPQWDPNTISNDIAIIRFVWVEFTNVIRPVALPTGNLQNNQFDGMWGQISGFGLTEMGMPANQVQHHADVQIISNDVCRQSFSTFVFDSTICTSGAGGVGICTGDSGGPLSVLINNQRVQIGVNSFGSSVCGNGAPSAYARVTSFLSWILPRL